MDQNFNLPPGCHECDLPGNDDNSDIESCIFCSGTSLDPNMNSPVCWTCVKQLCVICGQQLVDEEPPINTDAICATCEHKQEHQHLTPTN